MKSRNLVLVRHGQSEWNAKNLFTGWKDPGLTDQGLAEAKNAGKLILDESIQFDLCIHLCCQGRKKLAILFLES